MKELKKLSYSVRRFFVDDFFCKEFAKLEPTSLVIDMGGKKEKKRGVFNIDNYISRVEYANISKESAPDYLCNIESIPVNDCTYDIAVLSEVVEHLEDPNLVLKEAYRILKEKGLLYICTPFIYHIHGDPQDFARYTDCWYRNNLERLGFKVLKIEKQGLFFSVLANMLRLYLYELYRSGTRNLAVRFLNKYQYHITKKIIRLDNNTFIKTNKILSGYSTGFAIVCQKL